ncbi:MAG: elongator complex protein 3 [Thermodesulfobacteriota bacterium]
MDPSLSPPWIAPFFLAHVGCPHRCVFCNQHLIAETASPPSPMEVGEALKALWRSGNLQGGGRRQVAFYGGSFTGMALDRQEAYLDVCRPHVRRGWVDSIRISTRPDRVSERQLAFLAERNVRTVELGVQSLSDRVLHASRRGYTGKEARDAILRVRAMGLESGAQIMVGLPEDTGSESLETVEELAGLKPDFVRIYPLLVLRQTELAQGMRKGAYTPLGLEEAVSLCVRMLERFERVSIPVIRIGLQEQEGMGREGGDVLAGPYHPAFGHLVRSALFLKKVVASLPEKIPGESTVCLRIHPHDRSLLVGDRRQNLGKIQDVLEGREVRIEEDQGMSRGAVECMIRGQRSKVKVKRDQGSGGRPGTPPETGKRKTGRLLNRHTVNRAQARASDF